MERMKPKQLIFVLTFKDSDEKVTQKNKMIVFSLYTTHLTAEFKEEGH